MIHERGTAVAVSDEGVHALTLALDRRAEGVHLPRPQAGESADPRGRIPATHRLWVRQGAQARRAAYTVCGTPDYLAPETLRQQGCNRAADFWAIGVLLFEMMTGSPPFHGQTHSDLYRRITAGRMRSFPRQFDEDAGGSRQAVAEAERGRAHRRRRGGDPEDPPAPLLQGL